MCSLSLDIKDMSILSGTSTKKSLKNMLQHGPPHHRALERKPPDFQPDLLGSTTGLSHRNIIEIIIHFHHG